MSRFTDKLIFWRKKEGQEETEHLNETLDLNGIDWQDGALLEEKEKPKWWAFGKKKASTKSLTKDIKSVDWEEKTRWDDVTHPKLESIERMRQTQPTKHDIEKGAKPAMAHPQEVEESQKTTDENKQERSSAMFQKVQSFFEKSFVVILIAFIILFSLPIWVTAWLPMEGIATRLGLLSVLQYNQLISFLDPTFVIEPTLYASSFSSYFLLILMQGFEPLRAVQILLQFYILLTPLMMLFFLRSLGRSRWNVFFLFFFLYNGIFLKGQFEFLLAMPFLLWGIGSFFQWIMRDRMMALFSFVFALWGVFFIDLSAYLLLFAFLLLSLFFLTRSFAEWFGNFILLSLSSIIIIPWGYFLITSQVSLVNTHQLFSYVGYSSRFSFFFEHLAILFSNKDSLIWLIILALFLLLGLFLQDISFPKEFHFSARQYPFVSILLLLIIYVILPTSIFGNTLNLYTILALVSLFFVASIDLKLDHFLAYLLLFSLLVSGVFASFSVRQRFVRYHAEMTVIEGLLKMIPPKHRLLTWHLGRSQEFNENDHNVGGLYMSQKGGLSNLELSQLNWHFIHLRKGIRLPSSKQKKLPSLKNWDYLLVGDKLPRYKLRNLSIMAMEGRFSLYRIKKRRR